MEKKFFTSQAKMNKLKFSALIVALFMLGCDQPNTPNSVQIGSLSTASDEAVLNENDKNQIAAFDRACEADKNTHACMSVANMLFHKKRYSEAAAAYDQICSGLQHIPACLQLAKMFEEGLGVSKNNAIAKDIYEKACYSGDKASCSRMK